jgi:hypothetical protein
VRWRRGRSGLLLTSGSAGAARNVSSATSIVPIVLGSGIRQLRYAVSR